MTIQILVSCMDENPVELEKKLNLENSILKLDSLSPLKIMHRGYTLIQKDSQMIKSVNELKENDIIDIHFHDGY